MIGGIRKILGLEGYARIGSIATAIFPGEIIEKVSAIALETGCRAVKLQAASAHRIAQGKRMPQRSPIICVDGIPGMRI